MANSSYFEKLRDPRWQKKRLEVMQAADFHCEICGDGEHTLNVHHKTYFKGREPWEYESKQLACLCESCHASVTETGNPLQVSGSYAQMDGPGNIDECASLVAGFLGLEPDVIGICNNKTMLNFGVLVWHLYWNLGFSVLGETIHAAACDPEKVIDFFKSEFGPKGKDA